MSFRDQLRLCKPCLSSQRQAICDVSIVETVGHETLRESASNGVSVYGRRSPSAFVQRYSMTSASAAIYQTCLIDVSH